MTSETTHPISFSAKESGPKNRMLVTFQFPVVDLRPLFVEREGRLGAPAWPDPRQNLEFVRGAGVVRPRPSGPIIDWDGEGSYVEASKLLRLNGPDQPKHGRVVYRRLYGTQTCYRVDIAFAVTARFRQEHSQKSVNPEIEIATKLARIPVTVGDFHAANLAGAGVPLKNQLWLSTTSSDYLADNPKSHLRTGQPMSLVEISTNHSAPEQVILSASTMPAATRLPIYCFRHDQTDPMLNRRVRTALWRLNTELEVLREIARTWDQTPDLFEIDNLLDYLESSTRYLVQAKRNSVEQFPLVALANSLPNFPSTEISRLAELTAKRSKGIQRRLELITERIETQRLFHHHGLASVTVNQTKKVEVTNNEFNIEGAASGVFGSGNTVHGNEFTTTWTPPLDAQIHALMLRLNELDEQTNKELSLGSYTSTVLKAAQEKDPGKLRKVLRIIRDTVKGLGDTALPVLQSLEVLDGFIS